METPDVAVIGAGVMGLGIAGELADLDLQVALFDRDWASREASYASGGMLSPFMEVEFEELELLELNRKSLENYPRFVRELEDEVGMGVGYGSSGSLFVSRHPEQDEDVERLHEYQTHLGLEVSRHTGEELRQMEPVLSPEVRMGLRAPDERRVNNRLLCLALYRRCRRRGVDIHTNEAVTNLNYNSSGKLGTVETEYSKYATGMVIIAAGAWSGEIEGLKEPDRMPVRPVKGQAVSVRIGPSFQPDHVIRSPDVYGVPHPPERFLLGASMEEKGYKPGNTAGKVFDLLHAASELLPHLRERELLETWWGFRPATRDSRPIIGPSVVTPNLHFATGHYRNGILLTPITIQWISRCIQTGEIPSGMEPFLPARFQESNSGAAGNQPPSSIQQSASIEASQASSGGPSSCLT